ncbi:MAG TPA: hypothetical protein VEH07_11245 [Alphaproteobacteria bacterium]|nr:hypothetical protein [Alphaproteobacteria bacterium]
MISDGLAHVYWLGGGSGAGKSTIARRLAAHYGLRLYSTDDAMAAHDARCDAKDCPYLAAFKAMSMDERWLNRSPEVMLETFHWFRGEGFNWIVDDLLAMPAGENVIAEGFRLLPLLVRPLLATSKRAVWLLPTREFRRKANESRGTLWSIAGKTTDPPRALDNLLTRDHLFTERIGREAKSAGLQTIKVDGSLSEEELASQVGSRFDLI